MSDYDEEGLISEEIFAREEMEQFKGDTIFGNLVDRSCLKKGRMSRVLARLKVWWRVRFARPKPLPSAHAVTRAALAILERRLTFCGKRAPLDGITSDSLRTASFLQDGHVFIRRPVSFRLSKEKTDG